MVFFNQKIKAATKNLYIVFMAINWAIAKIHNKYILFILYINVHCTIKNDKNCGRRREIKMKKNRERDKANDSRMNSSSISFYIQYYLLL